MKKSNFITYVIFIFLLILVLISLSGCTFNQVSIETEDSEYINNNKYNSDFSFYDIDTSENAIYAKYITSEAEKKLLNQKINIEIKSVTKLEEIDERSATISKTTYVFLLEDYNNNTWLSISNRNLEDNSYNIKIKDNLILYGKYLGIIEYEGKKYPQIDVSYVYKNLDKIDISTYTQIADNYIQHLQALFPKESFCFKEMKKETGYNELIYINKNNDLTITIIIDDGLIKMTDLVINNIDFNINTIDKNFLLAFIKTFDSSINNPNDYLHGAINNKYEQFTLNGIVSDCGITNSSITLYYDIK